MTIKRVYTRHYRDNAQRTCYVEWSDGSRTEGPAYEYHGLLLPAGAHMKFLFDQALKRGMQVGREVW